MPNYFICECRELVIKGERFPMPHRHNCEYVKKRNALIPRAEALANERVSIVSAKQDDGASLGDWTRAFAAAMDELARPLLNGKHG